jgi:hypothetical protein
MNLYILTEGCYSDYHIIGAYSTKELAEEAQSLYPYAEIEEYGLDYIPEHPPGMSAWRVYILDGEITGTYSANPLDTNIPYESYSVSSHPTHKGIKCASFNIWAVDREHAEKIALDKWYQHQAQEAGIA